MRRESGKLTVSDLASRMGKSKVVGDQNLSNEERATLIQNFHPNLNDEVDFEFYLRVSFDSDSNSTDLCVSSDVIANFVLELDDFICRFI